MWSSRPVRNTQGELIGFAKVTRDLTQRRAHEEELRRSEERFLALLIESVPDYAIFMLDPNGQVANLEHGRAANQGLSTSGLKSSKAALSSVFYPDQAKESRWPEHELQVAAERGSFTDVGWRLRKDGTTFWAHVTITALRDDTGKLLGYAKLTRDLTETKRVENLESINQQRERDVRRRAECTYMTAQRATRLKGRIF